MNDILISSKKIAEEITAHRRYLHENPELGNDLLNTTKYVTGKLKEMGYEPKEICKSGIVTIAGGKKPGKTSW